MDIKNLGSKLRLLRTNLNLNQTAFAEKIGITQSTLSSYEKVLQYYADEPLTEKNTQN